MKLRKLLSILTFAASMSVAAQDGIVDVAIFSLNDFHGGFVQNSAQDIPGAASVLQTLDSLKSVYPHNIVVSAGDNFGGSYFYTATKGQLLPVFFNEAGIRISAVGNHEFDDGLDELSKKWKDDPIRPKGWDIKYICSNVYDAKGNIPSCMQPFTVEEISVSPTKKVKVAFVGMLASSAKTQISARRIVGMTFRGDYTKVLDSLKALPEYKTVDEADLRFFFFHIGANQKKGSPVWYDKNEEELYKLNNQEYHGFIAGHSHDPVCGYINDSHKPVVQGWWHGMYICMLNCRVDTMAMKVLSVEPEIVRVPLRQRSELTPHALRMQQQVDSLLECTKTLGGVPIGTQVAFCSKSMPHDRNNKYRITEVGTLVCESYAYAYRKAKGNSLPVIGVSHFGSARGGFVKGNVSVLDVGEVLPFQNNMCAFLIDGKKLRELVEFGYHNERFGWMQYSGLRVVLNADGHVKKMYYVNPDGSQKRVKNKKKYIIVCDSFMSGGGDDYDKKFFPEEGRIDVELPAATDCLIQYLQHRKTF